MAKRGTGFREFLHRARAIEKVTRAVASDSEEKQHSEVKRIQALFARLRACALIVAGIKCSPLCNAGTSELELEMGAVHRHTLVALLKLF